MDKQLENASLKWFMESEAITQEDFDNYQKIRKRRNEITHELLKNLNIGFTEDDIKLFVTLTNLYEKLTDGGLMRLKFRHLQMKYQKTMIEMEFAEDKQECCQLSMILY